MKKWFMISGLIVILGGLIFIMTSCSSNWDMRTILGIKKEETITNITDDFGGINISVDTVDINFVLTSDNSCKVVAYDRKMIRYDVAVEDGILSVKTVDERRWFERIFTPGGASLTVYLPKSEYDSLYIDASTGDITVPQDFKLGSIDIQLSTGDTQIYASADESVTIKGSTGDVTVEAITCASLEVKISTGATTLKRVSVSGNINMECSTGDTELSDVSCNNLTSVGDTGDIKITGLTATENISVERSTGDVSVHKIDAAANLLLKTSTGKIDISSANCADLRVNVTTGKSYLSNINCSNFNSTGDTGDLDMTDLIASGKIGIERSTGDVSFNRCDASELEVETSTGSVTGALITEKVFIVKTSSGRIDVPETITGGKCKITTSTGNIKIEIAE